MRKEALKLTRLSAIVVLVVGALACQRQERVEVIAEEDFQAQESDGIQWGAPTHVAHGELLDVDPDAGTFTLVTADGQQTQFRYDPWTEVTGSREGVEGLYTQTGTSVEVEYEAHGLTRLAKKVNFRR